MDTFSNTSKVDLRENAEFFNPLLRPLNSNENTASSACLSWLLQKRLWKAKKKVLTGKSLHFSLPCTTVIVQLSVYIFPVYWRDLRMSRQLAQHLSVKVTHIYNSDNVLSLGAIEERGKLLSATQRTLVYHFYYDNIRFQLILS